MADDQDAARATDQDADPEHDDDETAPDGLGDAGKEALRKEREKRRDAANRAKAAETELAALRQKQAEADAAAAKAAEDEAKRKGEFEQLAAKREQERDAATAERDSYKARAEQAEALIAAQVEARVKALPEKVRKLIRDGSDPIDTFGRLPELEDLAADLDGAGKPPKSGNGRNPAPLHGARGASDEAKRAALARQYRDF